ncbi:transposase [Streptomyces sp. NPDC058330]|uniref:IS110 family transposase n=1 Tax=Streptomyces sp. NPDC058330 TaxID=3346449 RepID=UPI0036EAFFF5
MTAAGVEGTGAYGAEPARFLGEAGLKVVEVDRPDRETRRLKGKSDPIDAYAAAIAVASGRASGTPKTRNGAVEAVRALRVPRRSAVKSRTQAVNQARQLLVTAPEPLRGRLRWDERTRTSMERRTGQGPSKKDIRRCLKRHVAREVHRVLTRSLDHRTATRQTTRSDLTEAA